MESIIHDDIIDNETIRRQKDPFHIKYGYNASILTGDFVLGTDSCNILQVEQSQNYKGFSNYRNVDE